MFRLVRLSVGVVCVAALSATAGALAADWNPRLAAAYLDERQKAWFAWKPAASPEGPCVSCHTGMTYLMARPELRRALGERDPTLYERGLLDRLRSKVGPTPPGTLRGIETIFAALFLAGEDSPGTRGGTTRLAFERLWALQLDDGPDRGSWQWYTANLEPWEHDEFALFGAALSAVALARTPSEYRRGREVRQHTASMLAFLDRTLAEPRPLHDRAAVLWASSALEGALAAPRRAALVAELLMKQSADGGWSTAALGPWAASGETPSDAGSNGYATAFVTFVLGEAGVPASDTRLARALDWLAAHQDPQTGAWPAPSMNKRSPPDSMEARVMQDAATGFASLALLRAAR
jgi:squalene-hopene/tetraprenyl-beta-curcumene cyclase